MRIEHRRAGRGRLLALLALLALVGCTEQVPEPTVPAALAAGPATSAGVARQVQGCNLEMAAGAKVEGAIPAKGQPIPLSGWIAGELDAQGVLTGFVTVQVARSQPGAPVMELNLPAAKVGHREDVARALGEAGLADAGFEARLDVAGLVAGAHVITLKRGEYTCGQSFALQKG